MLPRTRLLGQFITLNVRPEYATACARGSASRGPSAPRAPVGIIRRRRGDVAVPAAWCPTPRPRDVAGSARRAASSPGCAVRRRFAPARETGSAASRPAFRRRATTAARRSCSPARARNIVTSGVLGSTRGYTAYTNLRGFLTAYTHLK